MVANLLFCRLNEPEGYSRPLRTNVFAGAAVTLNISEGAESGSSSPKGWSKNNGAR